MKTTMTQYEEDDDRERHMDFVAYATMSPESKVETVRIRKHIKTHPKLKFRNKEVAEAFLGEVIHIN